ncbi:MAG TPA: hypothetical protein VLL47_13345, partial [Robiginitalea sp.]|nr:hypothetical protein [Robiginitalea sp.]
THQIQVILAMTYRCGQQEKRGEESFHSLIAMRAEDTILTYCRAGLELKGSLPGSGRIQGFFSGHFVTKC